MWRDDEGTDTRSLPRRTSNLELQLANAESEILKLKQQLKKSDDALTEVTNKLHQEETKCVQYEEDARKRNDALQKGKLQESNLELALESANAKLKMAESEKHHLQLQLEDAESRNSNALSHYKTLVDSGNRRIALLEAENKALQEQQSSQLLAASTPLPPRNKQTRRSSSNYDKTHILQHELQVCHTTIAQLQSQGEERDTKLRLSQDKLLQSENSRIALEKRLESQKHEMLTTIQELKDELSQLRQGASSARFDGLDRDQYEALVRAKEAVDEEVSDLRALRKELQAKLDMKTKQLATLQDKYDDLQFSQPQCDKELQDRLAAAEAEAENANEALSLYKERMHGRRDSFDRVQQELHDKVMEVDDLHEQLRRRESTTLSLDAQTRKNMELLHDREDARDALAKANAQQRELQYELDAVKREIERLAEQELDYENSLQKARNMIAEQQLLQEETNKACIAAEKRVTTLERQLEDLQEEMSNRSTISEARERDRQWKEAVDKVQALERELVESRQLKGSIPPSQIPLPFDQDEEETLARLLVAVDRLRSERDQLRRDLEFSQLELEAITSAVKQKIEEHRERDLQKVSALESEVQQLKNQTLVNDAEMREASSKPIFVDCGVSPARPQSQYQPMDISITIDDLKPPVPQNFMLLGSGPATGDNSWVVNDESVCQDADTSGIQLLNSTNELYRKGQHPQPSLPEETRKFVDELQLRIDRRTEQIGMHQHEIRRLEMNLKMAEGTIDDMRNELEELRAERDNLEEDAGTVRDSWAFDKKTLETLEQTLQESLTQQSRHKEELVIVEAARTAELSELVAVVAASVAQRRNSQRRLTIQSSELESLRSQLSQAEVTAAEETRRLSELHQSTCKQLVEQANEETRLRHEVEDANKRIQHLRRRLSSAEQPVVNIEEQTRIQSLLEDMERLESEVESLEERLSHTQNELKDSELQRMELDSRLVEVEHALEEQVQEFKSVVGAQKREIEEMIVARRTMEEATQTSLQLSTQENRDIMQRLELTKDKLLDSEEKVVRLENDLDLAIQEKEELMQQLDTARNKIAELIEETQILVKQVETADTTSQHQLNELEATLQNERSQLSALREERMRLLDDQEDSRRRVKRLENELVKVTEELNQAEKTTREVVQLRAELKELQEVLARTSDALHEAQQAASAAASTTVRDAEANIKIIQLESELDALKEENRELESVLNFKSSEIERFDDRILELMRERKKLVLTIEELNRKLGRTQGNSNEGLNVLSSSTTDLPPTVTGPIGPSPVTVETMQTDNQLVKHIARAKSSSPPIFTPPASATSTAPLKRSTTATSMLSFSPTPDVIVSPPTALIPSPVQAPILPSSVPLPLSPPNAQSIQQTPGNASSPSFTGSNSRKRRLPDDFDPSPEERLPPMPVMAVSTPSRLRRAAIRDGVGLRKGFTPSRSRNVSASGPPAAVPPSGSTWTINLGPDVALAAEPATTKEHEMEVDSIVPANIPAPAMAVSQSSNELTASRGSSRPRAPSNSSSVASSKPNLLVAKSSSSGTVGSVTTASRTRPTGGWLSRTRENRKVALGVGDAKPAAAVSAEPQRKVLSSLNGSSGTNPSKSSVTTTASSRRERLRTQQADELVWDSSRTRQFLNRS